MAELGGPGSGLIPWEIIPCVQINYTQYCGWQRFCKTNLQYCKHGPGGGQRSSKKNRNSFGVKSYHNNWLLIGSIYSTSYESRRKSTGIPKKPPILGVGKKFSGPPESLLNPGISFCHCNNFGGGSTRTKSKGKE